MNKLSILALITIISLSIVNAQSGEEIVEYDDDYLELEEEDEVVEPDNENTQSNNVLRIVVVSEKIKQLLKQCEFYEKIFTDVCSNFDNNHPCHGDLRTVLDCYEPCLDNNGIRNFTVCYNQCKDLKPDLEYIFEHINDTRCYNL